jgi:hypothetical protein
VSGLEAILDETRDEEKRYERLKATNYYQQALTLIAKSDFLRKGEICERLDHAVYMTAS